MNGIIPFLLSVLPIVFLIWLMAKKNGLPSFVALPLIAVVILLIQLFYWGNSTSYISASIFASLISTLVPVSIIFGAILFNRFIEVSGSIVVIKRWLANITPNPTAQLMIIGWAFAFIIEGASGFGTPAAIAAPLLVSLGFRPIPICILALIMNSVPVSFGAVGTPTWYGFSQIKTAGIENFFTTVGVKSAIIHAVASLIIPVIALRFVVSWNEIKRNIVFVYISILACVIPYLIIAQFSDEFPSLIGGSIGLIVSVLVAKTGFGISKDFNVDEISLDITDRITYKKESNGKVLKALFPFAILIGILIVTRIKQLGLKGILTDQTSLYSAHLGIFNFDLTNSLTFKFTQIFGTTIGDKYQLLYVPALIPFVVTVVLCALLYRVERKSITGIFKSSLSSVKLTYVALFGAFVMVKLMKLSSPEQALSMVTVIGDRFSSFFGDSWIYFASYLGAIGAFFSGSNTVSNLTFGNIQQTIALNTGVSQTTMLALQSVGGAMGNMVCLNNIIAVCTVTGVLSKEGYIIKRTAIPMFVYGIVAGITVFVLMQINPSYWSVPEVAEKATQAYHAVVNLFA